VFVGGSDSCATPDAISGSGPFAFDNTAATTGAEGQANANCLFFGTMGITNDVWFTWTAGATGIATLTLCGGATMDSKVAVYAGSGCPGAAALACNDDSCSVQSQVAFAVTTGSTYTIQLGNFPTATGGSGTFAINVGGGLSVFGFEHAPLGSAGINIYGSGNLVVTNIGSSGNDGVEVATQQGEGHCYAVSDPDPNGTLPLGARITTSYLGSVMGSANQSIAEIVEEKDTTGWVIHVDFPGLGSPTYTIEAYFGEARVGVYQGNGSSPMKASKGAKILDWLGGGKPPPCCRCWDQKATAHISNTGDLVLTFG
jgi:hypothetical protein